MLSSRSFSLIFLSLLLTSAKSRVCSSGVSDGRTHNASSTSWLCSSCYQSPLTSLWPKRYFPLAVAIPLGSPPCSMRGWAWHGLDLEPLRQQHILFCFAKTQSDRCLHQSLFGWDTESHLQAIEVQNRCCQQNEHINQHSLRHWHHQETTTFVRKNMTTKPISTTYSSTTSWARAASITPASTETASTTTSPRATASRPASTNCSPSSAAAQQAAIRQGCCSQWIKATHQQSADTTSSKQKQLGQKLDNNANIQPARPSSSSTTMKASSRHHRREQQQQQLQLLQQHADAGPKTTAPQEDHNRRAIGNREHQNDNNHRGAHQVPATYRQHELSWAGVNMGTIEQPWGSRLIVEKGESAESPASSIRSQLGTTSEPSFWGHLDSAFNRMRSSLRWGCGDARMLRASVALLAWCLEMARLWRVRWTEGSLYLPGKLSWIRRWEDL